MVQLSESEREQLDELINRGRVAAYKRRHAQVLLLVDEGPFGPRMIDREAAERCGRRSLRRFGHAARNELVEEPEVLGPRTKAVARVIR